MSIFPDVSNGGVVVRNIAGVCTNQSEAPNAYCPPQAFLSTCEITALAEDCTARILPEQINAIVSELLCLAVYLDADGPWDCNSNCNLRNMFQVWASTFTAAIEVVTDGTTIAGNGTLADPIRLIPTGVVTAICEDDEAVEALVACVRSTDIGNVIEVGSDGKLYASGTVFTESPITGNGGEDDPIGLDIPALISTDEPNLLGLGTDEKLLVTVATGYGLEGDGTPGNRLRSTLTPAVIVAGICGDDEVSADLANCLISEDPFNRLAQGSDGGLYVPQAGNAGAIADGTLILFEIAFSRISGYADFELLSAYVPAVACILPANFPLGQIKVRNANNDIHIYLSKNQINFAQIIVPYAGGPPSWILSSDMSFAPGDILEFRGDGVVDFDLLSVTIVGHRPIQVA